MSKSKEITRQENPKIGGNHEPLALGQSTIAK
jgi:hypothetical protein